ncbi:FAD/NAD(P)-binding protein [Corynebacterium pacaense]|uniref:FAD/NAD(P)-binding protein n=1 Tax=Corynebacterium pacaense TaxID=1816684 RepID=UPI0009BC659C|nr:FAD/NAD(P)-binding protein [Corynebacterium pacaense]
MRNEEGGRDIAFVGGGPRTTGILLRLAARGGEFPGALNTIHVVDPHPAGGGRIWRREQSGLLWMNSRAEDVTIFADDSVDMDGPVSPGPRVDQWVHGAGRAAIREAGLDPEAEGFTGRTFPSRRMQSLYLRWAFEEAVRQLADLPEPVTVIEHRATATGVSDAGDHQLVRLDNGTVLSASTAILSQGHLDVADAGDRAPLRAAAENSGLIYVPPGFTADLDLSVVPAGKPAIVRGLGLAFIDAMVLLFEGRGGRYVRDSAGLLSYVPGGREPILWAGSRRGVPYQPKLGYEVEVHAGPPRYLDDQSLDRFGPGPLDYDSRILPIVDWNLRTSHYRQLWVAHPERTRADWAEVERTLAQLLPPELGGRGPAADADVRDAISVAVPDVGDHFDLAGLDRPFATVTAADHSETESLIDAYISTRLERSRDPGQSPDLALRQTLMPMFLRLSSLYAAGRVVSRVRGERLDRRLHGLFSYNASGPPPLRVEQLQALRRAGLLRFLGPGVGVTADGEGFHATSTATGARRIVSTTTLIDAHLAPGYAANVTDGLLRRLVASGDISIEDGDGPARFRSDASGHAIRGDGSVNHRLFIFGPLVAGGGPDAPFSRPGTGARGFQRADAVAGDLLESASFELLPRG